MCIAYKVKKKEIKTDNEKDHNFSKARLLCAPETKWAISPKVVLKLC